MDSETFTLSINIRYFLRYGLLLIASITVHAGIVEMPRIEDSSGLRGKSVYENYNIPSVRNRNPDPTIGPRLWVKEIRIQGVDEFPSLGIDRLEVLAYAEKLRYDIMRENELLEHGRSHAELDEIADLVEKLDSSSDYSHVATPDLQRFVWLLRDQKEKRGLTIGEIEIIATKVETYYRDRGLKLAKAFMPRQFMRDGILIITVLDGKLGAVEVEGNRRYSTTKIKAVFDNILGEPITFDRIEEKMYLLNDYPGLYVTGNFTPGYQVGDSRFILKVEGEQRIDSTLRLDNHGSELTGQVRVFGQFHFNNPLNLADKLSLSMLQSTSPDNSTYGQIEYKIPLFSPSVYLGVSTSRNQFILDKSQGAGTSIDDLGISGETLQQDFRFEYTFARGRTKNWWGDLIFSTTESILDSLEFGNLGLDDKTESITLQTRFDLLNSQNKVLQLGSISITSGEITEGVSQGQDEKYIIYHINYKRLTFLPLAWFDTNTRLILKAELQGSDSALPATEQIALAGPTLVRAFPVNQFSADTALYLGVEWFFNTPELLKFKTFETRGVTQKMQPFLFMNMAKGKQNSISAGNDKEATLMGAGFGLQFAYGTHVSGNLQFAFPVADDFKNSSITVPDESLRVVFDVQYQF